MISTKGRYALRLMLDLAQHGNEGCIPLKDVAQRQDISEKYLELILRALVREGYLSGLRGKGGGYHLAKAASEITVGSILRLTEDRTAPVACLSGDAPHCERSADCLTLPLWKKADNLINTYFDSVTLQDLLDGNV